MLGPLVKEEIKYRADRIRGIERTVASVVPEVTPTPDPSENPENSPSPAPVPTPTPKPQNQIIPVSTKYGIVIEKINANAKVIPAVNPADEKEYTKALSEGVAEALGSTPPGQPGNLYIFSHSTDAPWNIIRYNAIFYLLKELEKGDRVIIFYNDRRYDYIVFEKLITSPADVAYLKDRYKVPILTLQTCDPPGTLINRLIVRAKLVGS